MGELPPTCAHTGFFFSQDDLVTYMLCLLDCEKSWFLLRRVSTQFDRLLTILIDTRVIRVDRDNQVRPWAMRWHSLPDDLSHLLPKLDALILVPYRLREGRVLMIDMVFIRQLIYPRADDLRNFLHQRTPYSNVSFSINAIHIANYRPDPRPITTLYRKLCSVGVRYHVIVVELKGWHLFDEDQVWRINEFIRTGVLYLEGETPYVLPRVINVVCIAFDTVPNPFYRVGGDFF